MLAAKANKCVERKESKNRVTTLLFCNMDRSNRAWTKRNLFREGLTEFDEEMIEKKRKILVLLNNCTVHHINPHFSNVEVFFLPPTQRPSSSP
ncbi:hypothetical protein HPB47_006736 [Ixodes persulcatus]|uniref:Uncharacterized protein n=1 Tax=Ixodes persulcatus TaxID=34615 RepID=A0AC60P9N0_IXOPE|nr:hypothetical protein HPB47_006736 [Ixodes persulcatus]